MVAHGGPLRDDAGEGAEIEDGGGSAEPKSADRPRISSESSDTHHRYAEVDFGEGARFVYAADFFERLAPEEPRGVVQASRSAFTPFAVAAASRRTRVPFRPPTTKDLVEEGAGDELPSDGLLIRFVTERLPQAKIDGFAQPHVIARMMLRVAAVGTAAAVVAVDERFRELELLEGHALTYIIRQMLGRQERHESVDERFLHDCVNHVLEQLCGRARRVFRKAKLISGGEVFSHLQAKNERQGLDLVASEHQGEGWYFLAQGDSHSAVLHHVFLSYKELQAWLSSNDP